MCMLTYVTLWVKTFPWFLCCFPTTKFNFQARGVSGGPSLRTFFGKTCRCFDLWWAMISQYIGHNTMPAHQPVHYNMNIITHINDICTILSKDSLWKCPDMEAAQPLQCVTTCGLSACVRKSWTQQKIKPPKTPSKPLWQETAVLSIQTVSLAEPAWSQPVAKSTVHTLTWSCHSVL